MSGRGGSGASSTIASINSGPLMMLYVLLDVLYLLFKSVCGQALDLRISRVLEIPYVVIRDDGKSALHFYDFFLDMQHECRSMWQEAGCCAWRMLEAGLRWRHESPDSYLQNEGSDAVNMHRINFSTARNPLSCNKLIN